VKPARALALACLLALLCAGRADAHTSSDFTGHHRQIFRVVVVQGLGLGDLPVLASEGAVGLVVPNAGPRTSAADAFAGMVRGILYNARLPHPHGEVVLIHVQSARAIPLRGPVIVVGLPPGRTVANDRRYPIAVIGHGYRPGDVLRSSLTRVPGLVSMADVARTALQAGHSLSSRPDPHAVQTLDRLESRIRVARNSAMAAAVLVLSLLVLIALFFPAGTIPGFIAALTANLALGWLLDGSAEMRVTLVGVCTVAGAVLGARYLRAGTALGVALVTVLAAYALTMAVEPSVLSLAPIGPELTSRFFGVSNQLETLLLVPALLGARLLAARFGSVAFAAVAVLSLVTIAENQLGADGGGAVVVGVGFAVLAVAMAGAGWRLVVPALAGAALAVLALLDVDAASSSPDHLRGALHGGFNGLAQVAANRVPLAYDRALEQWWLLVPTLPAIVVGTAVVYFTRPRRRASAMLALLAALAVSLLVNDSPGPVMLAGLAAVLALDGGFVHRTLALPVLRRLGTAGITIGPARPQE
jgi:hypothetical protein